MRQLLEYKAFKMVAAELTDAAQQQAMKFPRQPATLDTDSSERDLENVQIWDLLDAFSKVMESIGARPRLHEVIYDDTPIELHATDIMDRLGREGPMPFDRIFAGRQERSQLVGLFLAMLELIRQRRIRARQEGNFQQILIELTGEEAQDAPRPDGEYVSDAAAGNSAQGQYEGPASPNEAHGPGEYVSDAADAADDEPDDIDKQLGEIQT